MRTGMRAPRPALHRDRDPGEPGRARAPVPVGSRHGRPRGPAAALEVARDRQAAGARGAAGDERSCGRTRSGRGAGRRSAQAGIDKDKGEAVCVYLWVRDQKLCSGPGAAGPAMDASLTVGQLDQLRPGVICQLPAGQIRTSAVDAARARDRRPRHRRERRARAARAPAGGRAGRARRARGRARLRRRPLPRQPVRVPRRAAGGSS